MCQCAPNQNDTEGGMGREKFGEDVSRQGLETLILKV